MDWLDLLAVQGTLKSLLQHHSTKASFLQCSVFFMVQLSHLYISTGKPIAFHYAELCQQNDVSAFNTLSRFVIAFLSKRERLLISRLQSLSVVFWSPRKENRSLLPLFPLLFAMK